MSAGFGAHPVPRDRNEVADHLRTWPCDRRVIAELEPHLRRPSRRYSTSNLYIPRSSSRSSTGRVLNSVIHPSTAD